MATPAKTVQARDVATLLKVYRGMKIPTFAIKQGAALCFKWVGEDMEEGAAQLEAYLQLLEDTETAAIYTLCQYEELKDGRLTDKTPCDLSNNFRLNDHVAGYGGHDQYGGTYGALLGEIKELRKEMNALKSEPAPENKLGMIGELMELEAFQPIMMGLATRAADWIMGAGKEKVGELRRVSGVPTAAGTMAGVRNWREDARICSAVDALNGLEDLPDVLEKLAGLYVKKPGQFKLYKTMLLTMKL